MRISFLLPYFIGSVAVLKKQYMRTLKYKDLFYFCTFFFFLVLGRLAVNGENLLPNHPEGCPDDIPARLPCFIAGQ